MLSVAILSRQRYTSKGPVHLQALIAVGEESGGKSRRYVC